MRRPESLAEVATCANNPATFHLQLADFLDEFRSRRDPVMLNSEPARLARKFAGGDVADAYLAAVALSLAREERLVPPAWVWSGDRRLPHPWFASPGPAIRATLLLESPAPFRERNLFVSENALARA